jgi:hypothetical protein
MPAGIQSIVTAWSELASTTYRNHSKEVADNVSKHNALFRRLTAKDKVRLEEGGLTIVQPLDYQANSTYQRYSGYDVLNINAVDVLTAAEYPWRQVAVNVAASGLEIRTNAGPQRIVNFTKSKIKNAMRSMANGLSVDMYSDGTAANQINGIQAIVADTGLGTVGGINAANFPFWANVVNSAAAPINGGGAVTVGPSTIESLMLQTWIRCTRGMDMPDMIVMSDDYFTAYEQSQTSLKRYAGQNESDSAQGGFISMKYKTADVFFDSSGGIPTQHAYFLNTDYLDFVAHKDANMTMMDDLKSVNQDAVVIPVLYQGNLVCSARFLQGVVKA